MALVTRTEFDHPPWKAAYLAFQLGVGDLSPLPVWGLLRGLHPFSVTVEPTADFQGAIQLVVSNDPYAGPGLGILLPTLSDPITGAYEFTKDSPYQWLGVLVLDLTLGSVAVKVFASPYSRNIQP